MEKMQIVKLEQGSPEWLEHRRTRFNASDAPAMLGTSKYKTRTELLHEYSTGERKPVSKGQQIRFDDGHRVEALARPILEEELDEELYPDVGILDYEGLPLGSSFDGLSMLWDVNFEHKIWNATLVNYINEHKDLPDSHWPQVEQQMLMAGSEVTHFIVSDGTEDKRCKHEYQSMPERREQLILGWLQFQKDLATYVPKVKEEVAVADSIETLPTLHLEIKGEVATNMPLFKEKALAYIEGINTTLVEDLDFANAEADIKFCSDAEKQLKDIKEAAFKNTADIKEAMETINEIGSQLRDKRLIMQKLVKSEKEARKANLVFESVNEMAEHIIDLEKELQGFKVPKDELKVTMEAAIKNKRTMDSMRTAASTAIANCKIEADKMAGTMRTNLAALGEVKEEYGHLFNDFAAYIYGDTSHTKLMIDSRVRDEKDRLQAKLDAEEARKKEVEEKRIRDEQAAKEKRIHDEGVAAEEAVNTAERKNVEPIKEATKPTPTTRPTKIADPQQLSDDTPKADLDGHTITVSGTDFSEYTLEDITSEFNVSFEDYEITFSEKK